MFISLKMINIKKVDKYWAIAVNYTVAAIFTLVDLALSDSLNLYSSKFILPSLFVAFLFVTSFIVMSYSTQKVGIGLTTALNKMSVAIPVIVGILYLGQQNDLYLKLFGIVITLISFALILYKKSKSISSGAIILPALVFILSGMIDTSMELANTFVISLPAEQEVFLLGVFLFSIVFSLLSVVIEKVLKKSSATDILDVKFSKLLTATLFYGSLLGLFNFLTSKMILINVGKMGGSIVFPIHNASVVTFTALIGLLFFKESFTKKQWIGILLAVLGVSLIASTL